MSNSHEADDNEVIEAWPSLQSTTSDALFTGFAKHDILRIELQQPTSEATSAKCSVLNVECASALSPLDMINLSQGTHDATGHRVWMGAFLLIEALAADSPDHQDIISNQFLNKRVLELGSGTGVAGLTVMLTKKSTPLHLVFSDADEKVLELCRKNCERNLPPTESRFSVHQVCWGSQDYFCNEAGVNCQNASREIPSKSTIVAHSYDTVLATDVIYDLGCLKPLLWTVTQSLRLRGHFVLSHVPRACLPDQFSTNHDYQTTIEQIIINVSKDHGLELVTTLRPSSLRENHQATATRVNSISLEDMEEAGASILIFQKIKIS